MANVGKSSFKENSLFNFLSQIIVFAIAFLCIPHLISSIGNERFGLLSLLWMFVGYFTFLDFGIGQATVKFVSEKIAANQPDSAVNIVRSSIKFSFVLSIIGCILIYVATLLDVQRFLGISPALYNETKQSLYVLTLCLPAVLLQGTLRAIPLAFNRFELVNGITSIGGFLQWFGSLCVVLLGGNFFGIIVLTVVVRYAVLFLYCWLNIKLLPEVIRPNNSETISRQILSYGGWYSVSQILAPLLLLFERFIITSLLSLAWVTFYTVPADAVMKLLIIPMSLATTLFPTISGNWISEQGKEQSKQQYLLSIKYTFLLLLPILFTVLVFNAEILQLWVGEEFSRMSSGALTFFSIGILFHSLAQFPSVTLLGIGRPDYNAKLLLIEFPIYLILCYVATSKFGIVGTAFLWCIRVCVEMIYLFAITHKHLFSVRYSFDFSYIWKALGLLFVSGVLLFIAKSYSSLVFSYVLATGIFMLMYSWGLWFLVFDENDKNQFFVLKSKLLFSNK
jgi:O-antigen/teichoic acid export membrane protein